MLLETEILDQQCLKQLAKGEVLAIRVKQYLPTDLSRKLADKIMKPGYAHQKWGQITIFSTFHADQNAVSVAGGSQRGHGGASRAAFVVAAATA